MEFFLMNNRSGPADWPGGDVAWRDFRSKEPFNAHSHLIAIALGTSESVPISKGAMRIGTYQNIIVVRYDVKLLLIYHL